MSEHHLTDNQQQTTVPSRLLKNEWFRAFLLALGLLILVHFFVLRFVTVESTSMYATLRPGDLLLVQRWPVWTGLSRGDVVVFRDPLKDRDPMFRRPLLVKRIVGMPGDTVELRHDVLLVNGEPQVLPPAATTSYLVRLAMGQRPDSLLALLGLPKSLVQPGRTAIELPLNKALAEIVERFHGVVSASPMRLASGAPHHIFPFSPRYPWNGDDFGPLVVPRKGGSIRIDVDDFPLYDRIMSTYEGHALSADRDRLMIDGRPLEAYVVERNYYFVLGDSRHFSADSRYWGFLPQDHIVGRGGAVVFHGGVR